MRPNRIKHFLGRGGQGRAGKRKRKGREEKRAGQGREGKRKEKKGRERKGSFSRVEYFSSRIKC